MWVERGPQGPLRTSMCHTHTPPTRANLDSDRQACPDARPQPSSGPMADRRVKEQGAREGQPGGARGLLGRRTHVLHVGEAQLCFRQVMTSPNWSGGLPLPPSEPRTVPHRATPQQHTRTIQDPG